MGPMRDRGGDRTYDRIYSVVRRIPRGRVATYGQIAREAGLPRHARHVGHALRALHPGSRLPWYRVINSRGEISVRAGEGFASQAERLEAEGVVLDVRGRVDLKRFGWTPVFRGD